LELLQISRTFVTVVERLGILEMYPRICLYR
jgi:hypothetical protein